MQIAAFKRLILIRIILFIGRQFGTLLEDCIDQAIIDGLGTVHEVISFQVFLHLLHTLTRVGAP